MFHLLLVCRPSRNLAQELDLRLMSRLIYAEGLTTLSLLDTPSRMNLVFTSRGR